MPLPRLLPCPFGWRLGDLWWNLHRQTNPQMRAAWPKFHGSLRIKILRAPSGWLEALTDTFFPVSFLTVVGIPSLGGMMKFDSAQEEWIKNDGLWVSHFAKRNCKGTPCFGRSILSLPCAVFRGGLRMTSVRPWQIYLSWGDYPMVWTLFKRSDWRRKYLVTLLHK